MLSLEYCLARSSRLDDYLNDQRIQNPKIKPLHNEKYTEFKKERHREEEERWVRGLANHIFV